MSDRPAARLATLNEIVALVELFCSARQEIGLAENVCSPAERDRLSRWFREKCEAGSIWTTDGVNTLAIVARNPFNVVEEMQYAVVSPGKQRRGLATTLIKHIQRLEGVHALRAEARNAASERMLVRCGFIRTEELQSGYPLLRWERS